MVTMMLRLAVTAVAVITWMGARPCLAQERPAISELKAIAEEAYL